MPLSPPGRQDRPPGKPVPPKSLGQQSFLWLIGGPHSEGDFNAVERRSLHLALRALVGCTPVVWLVLVVRLVALAPDEVLWWVFSLGILYYGISWIFSFGRGEPAVRPVRMIVVLVTIMLLLLAARLFADARAAWLLAVPAALALTLFAARFIATGMALWTTHVLTASPDERSVARGEWHAGHGTTELATIRRGHAVLVLAWLGAAVVANLTRDGFLPWLSFFVLSFGGWCLCCSAGRAPHDVAAITWRTVVLWLSYNPPLPSGRTLLEAYTYQMPEPCTLMHDRVGALRLAMMALSVAVVAAVTTSTLPVPGAGPGLVYAARDLFATLVRGGAVVTALPFLVFFTTLFVAYGTALTSYWGRFAASAVAEAKRRSPA
jgi:hypothetical protein